MNRNKKAINFAGSSQFTHPKIGSFPPGTWQKNTGIRVEDAQNIIFSLQGQSRVSAEEALNLIHAVDMSRLCYLRRKPVGQGEESVLFVVDVIGDYFQSLMYGFLGCMKQKTFFSKRLYPRAKLLINGVHRGQNFYNRGGASMAKLLSFYT